MTKARRGLQLARAFYAIAGGIALVGGALTVFSSASAAAQGCELVFSQSDIVTPPDTGPIPDQPACQQYVQLLEPAAAFLLAVVLLLTVIRLGRDPGHWGPIVPAGVVAGFVAGLAPLAFISWATSFYRFALGPVELLIAGCPLLLALLSAVAVWRSSRDSRPLTEPPRVLKPS
ncbi:MAG: hypothetical protein H0X16_05835 [Chloroflexi bacterium]|nr:hypothetical protein [Chloroflexota bacterium]